VKWEYLTLVWTTNAAKRDGPAPWAEPRVSSGPSLSPLSRSVAGQEQTHWYVWQQFEIWRPRAEGAETRDGWASDRRDVRISANDMLNELGGEGWELVSSEADRNKLTPSSVFPVQGWPGTNVGEPIRKRWILKRPVQSDDSTNSG
jgi:hypothetical protein